MSFFTANFGSFAQAIFPTSVNPPLNVDTLQFNSNTTAQFGALLVPSSIVVRKLTLEIFNVGMAGTLDIAFYSEDGQQKTFEVTTGSIAADGHPSVAVNAVTLNPGVYYVGIVPNGTADITVRMQAYPSADFDVSGEPLLSGSATVTAGTLPSTITPTSLTNSGNYTVPYLRLDS